MYRRVLLKLSGESLGGPQGKGIDENCLNAYAKEIAAVQEHTIAVKGGGLACALIRTDVFRRIGKPWFVFSEQRGEDYAFCKKCSDAGIAIYVDTRVGCGHIHDRVLEAR